MDSCKKLETSEQKCLVAVGSCYSFMDRGLQHAALVALSITGLIVCLQSVGRSKYRNWLPMLSWLLPVIGFSTLIISPKFEVPNSIMVSWLMILLIGWITDFMMQVDEEPVD